MAQLVLPSLRVSPSTARKSSWQSTLAKHGNRQIRTVAVEPITRAINGVRSALLSLVDGLSQVEREDRRLLEERIQILTARMHHSGTYEEWRIAAQELDELEGNDGWKAETSTGDYNPELIESRLKALDDARIDCDIRAMLHLVRTALSRDLGGMDSLDLYRHSHIGTKKLIERYVDSALQTILALVEQSSHNLPDGLETKDLLEAVLFARQSFGRSAMLLSGGGTFGMTHIGVLKALYEAKLLPRIISGASAGSIVCAAVCTTTDEEMAQLLEEFPYGDLSVFEEEGNEDSIFEHVRRLLTEGNWSDIKHLTRVMKKLLGDMTFQEAYNRTRRICNICVSSASIYELPRLLNYVTAPNVLIWSAVAASCSVPLVFSAAPLLVKNPLTGEHSHWTPTPQKWVDGSVDNDLPMTRLAEMFNVNHFIVSQVNPHVVPFLAKEDAGCPTPGSYHSAMRDGSDWMNTVTELAKSEALHRMHVLAEIGILPNLFSKLRSVLSQKYSGDINILPAIGVLDLPKILRNPTTEFMFRSCIIGERATWPKLSRIRDRCAIELALDRAVHALRARVVFSKSQTDLRRMVAGTLTNPFLKRSHDTLGPSAEMISAREKHKHRQRRLSGGSFQGMFPHRKHLDEPYKVTDDETDEEERLEMRIRRSHGKPRLRLKRSLKSLPLQGGPMTTPLLSTSNEPDAFNFAKPRSPPRLRVEHTEPPKSSHFPLMPDAIDIFDSPDIAPADGASLTSPTQDPTKLADLDSSDPHSSDADIDSQDESTGNLPLESSDQEPSETGQDWYHEMDRQPAQKRSKEDMFSMARRERNMLGAHESPQDPAGAGLWS